MGFFFFFCIIDFYQYTISFLTCWSFNVARFYLVWTLSTQTNSLKVSSTNFQHCPLIYNKPHWFCKTCSIQSEVFINSLKDFEYLFPLCYISNIQDIVLSLTKRFQLFQWFNLLMYSFVIDERLSFVWSVWYHVPMLCCRIYYYFNLHKPATRHINSYLSR